MCKKKKEKELLCLVAADILKETLVRFLNAVWNMHQNFKQELIKFVSLISRAGIGN